MEKTSVTTVTEGEMVLRVWVNWTKAAPSTKLVVKPVEGIMFLVLLEII